MALFFVGVLQKLCGYTFSVDSRGHEVVPFVSQNTHQLSSQRFIEKLDYSFPIRRITLGHGAIFDMLACALTQSFDVSEKWFLSHSLTS
jgi:hypothetical protein